MLLEARYDELTDMAGLRAELAAALARQARDAADLATSGSPDAGRADKITDADRLLRAR